MIVYYEPVKVTIHTPGLAKVIFNVVVRHHGLPNSIISDIGSVFTSKFWSLLYYFRVKRRFSTVFYLQNDGQTEKQNSTIDVYSLVFVNYKQNDWAKLLSIAEFAYNNTKNASISYASF